jgi:hypothetical protein
MGKANIFDPDLAHISFFFLPPSPFIYTFTNLTLRSFVPLFCLSIQLRSHCRFDCLWKGKRLVGLASRERELGVVVFVKE